MTRVGERCKRLHQEDGDSNPLCPSRAATVVAQALPKKGEKRGVPALGFRLGGICHRKDALHVKTTGS